LGYRVYSDACDVGIAAILQQVQPIRIRDLKGTKVYNKLQAAHKEKQPVPQLIVPISKNEESFLNGDWEPEFEETIVHVERVIAYWSRTLKPAEWNYSPTEREALALWDGLVKFQPYTEGEKITAVTNHAALVWSRRFQNVNQRLLTWGTVFAAYPDLQIIHRAGRVHSNVDPISRLRRNIPFQIGPILDESTHTVLTMEQDTLTDLYAEIAPDFEARVLLTMAAFEEENSWKLPSTFQTEISHQADANMGKGLTSNYLTARSYNIQVTLAPEEIENFTKG
jgi:RNase H-like domain found in reverse transcriptase